MTSRLALLLGALLMFCAVAAGAFGAHLLRGYLSPDMLAVWQTGVQYQAWHALALLAVGLYLQGRAGVRWVQWSGLLFAPAFCCFPAAFTCSR